MAIEIDTKLGKIDITSDVIATIAGGGLPKKILASLEWQVDIKSVMV